jgi:cysteinyl-tRNA synthetase
MNITDIDDKIILRAREQGIPFTQLARKWEQSFMEDMKALKVLPPDVLTRVTEYIPEIVGFVDKIISNGFAYPANGSVYFSTSSFSKSHNYAKLAPWAAGNSELMLEGEGALSIMQSQGEKQNANDFALWKKSKEGEPKWNSPWGEGRPGWHIECSAMASDILGDSIDIHSGGEDLRFPHHDNELAQSEAYFGCQQWVNYFIHSGHLHITGCKMSKSLKNFITIREALATYTARQIRFLFLLHKYESIMDYSDDALSQARDQEKVFAEFFHIVKAALRDQDPDGAQNWGKTEKALHESLANAKSRVHSALLDNFNTPEAMQSLAELVHKTHLYIASQKEASSSPRSHLLHTVADYITTMFKVFGLIDQSDIGFPVSAGDSNTEQILTPFLNAITQFREDVRSFTRQKETGKVLEVCDKLRDEVLPLLGVRLEDRPEGAIWKLGDKAEMLKELELKKAAEQEKAAAKQRAKEEKEEKERQLLEKMKIPPSELFRLQNRFSAFDETGFPSKDAEGKDLSKNAIKDLRKEHAAHTKLHQKYLDGLPK